MISSEEQQLREYLALDEVTFAIPAQSFAIACAISAEESLPVVTEFALRIAYVCGDLSPVQIQDFFGFSKKETDAVVAALLSEKLIQWNEDRLELTSYAQARFQDSSDNLPRFFKIQDWSAEVVFDLISFHPAGRPDRVKRVRFQIELPMRDLDKQSKTIQYAEQAFQQHFRSICKKDKAEIYKISAVDAGERFSIPLPCRFHLDLEGQTSVRRDIDDDSFGSRLEIAESISDALAHRGAGHNDRLRDFIRLFGDEVIGRYTTEDTFDLRRYVQDVHLSQITDYSDARVTPILGALYLERNAEHVLGRLMNAISEATQKAPLAVSEDEATKSAAPEESNNSFVASGATEPIRHDGLWLAPESTLWARSRRARDFALALEKLLAGDVRPSSPSLRVALPGDRRTAKDLLAVYWDHFPRMVGADCSLMDGMLELLVVPDILVCALFRFHLAHQPVSIPLGFISSREDHLLAATTLLASKMLAKPGTLTAPREDERGDSVRDVEALLQRIGKPSATLQVPQQNGRPKLALKRTSKQA